MSGMDEFKDLYIQTAKERIQQLNDLLIKLEANPTQLDIIQELMRAGHSLKGESAAMGYTSLATLAHIVEDLFTAIGNGEMQIKQEIMDSLFAAIDKIQESVNSIETQNQEINLDEPIATLKKVTGLKTEGFGKSDKSKPMTAAETAAAEASTTSSTPSETKPEEKAGEPEEEKKEEASPTTTPTTPTAAPAAAEKPATAEKISAVTLKVEKLDQMISISEELVLMKMKLKTNEIVQNDSNLKAEVHRLDRLVTDMQFHIMQARLFPISLALHTIPRLVRDTSKKTGKSVRLEMEGEDTTVDRTIIDHLTEPFVHMIRNAIDHGIEAPEERVKKGKSEEAVVKIKAYTKENKFYVEISDDGQGIEWDKVRAAAIKKGLVTKEQIEGWTDKQSQDLLFIGGVSTNTVVTDVSGRGVGMAAVKEAIKKLGGTIDIATIVGKGTTFILRLPMTLAIMQALLVKVGEQTYAIPGNEVVRSIQINRDEVLSSANTPVIVVDDQRVPIYDLLTIFHLEGLIKDADAAKRSTATVVLVRMEDGLMGCLVDKIVAEEEILVKQLGPLLKHSQHFSGATILANGAAAPIINIEGLKWKPSQT